MPQVLQSKKCFSYTSIVYLTFFVYVQKRLGTVFRHEFPIKKQTVILNSTKNYYQSISSFLLEYLFLAARVFTATRGLSLLAVSGDCSPVAVHRLLVVGASFVV